MKLVTNKFKSGGLHEKHIVSGNLESWEASQHLLTDTGKPRIRIREGKEIHPIPQGQGPCYIDKLLNFQVF